MKDYSVRIELNLQASNDDEAKKKTELIIKELPRMEGLSFKVYSVMNISSRKMVGGTDK